MPTLSGRRNPVRGYKKYPKAACTLKTEVQAAFLLGLPFGRADDFALVGSIQFAEIVINGGKQVILWVGCF